LLKEEQRLVGQEKGKLVPTAQGRAVLDFLVGKFNDLFEYAFTARMETRLDLIGDGAEDWKQILRDVWRSYKERYEAAKVNGAAVAAARRVAVAVAEVPVAGVEWEGAPVFRRKGPYGFYVACNGGKLKVGVGEHDEAEQILEKIRAKVKGGAAGGAGGAAALREGVFGEWPSYIIRQGPYGPYIMKKGLKKAQFVKLLETVELDKVKDMTEADVEALYKAGLEAKTARGGGRGGLRGGRRGGGGGRGGGRSTKS
jgi:hypothetical protein